MDGSTQFWWAIHNKILATKVLAAKVKLLLRPKIKAMIIVAQLT